ncbi:MAG TPA: hypothetical protein VF603_00170 [Allosphingosinicella sp.]|jgi:hypothetical protein
MTDRAQQLLLEVLLIQARYSPQEIGRLSRMLEEGSFSDEARHIMAAVERLAASGTKRRPAKPKHELDLEEAKKRFLAGLHGPKTSAEVRRLRAIAKRLRLDDTRPEGELVQRVQSEINRMSDRELRGFLKPYRLQQSADEGYVGLANYLMHNE